MKKISQKFLTVIGVLTGISVIALALLGFNIRSISSQSEKLIKGQVQNLYSINAISDEYQAIYRLTLCHIMANNDMSMTDYEKQITAAESALGDAMTQYSTGITGTEKEEIYNNLAVKVSAYRKTIDSIVTYSKANDKDKANMFATSSLKPINASLEGYLNQLKESTNNDMTAGQKQLEALQVTSNLLVLSAFVLLLIASVAVFIIARKSIVKPINKVTMQLNHIMDGIHNNEGDLNLRVQVTTKDEIATLTKGVNEFLDILQGMISNIIASSGQLDEKEKKVNQNVISANEAANDTSATMQELAAGMQEVSATVTTVNEKTQGVQASTSEMSEQAERGSDFALEMKGRASNLKKKSGESKSTANSMLGEIDQAVKNSVDDSKQIEKIASLTDEILGISSETNLLALNASIEAARAGEAGKGFAVVADQIRILADNSRKTANNIQDISDTVVGSVTLLAQNAMKLLEFVNDRVLSDYDMLEETGEQYLSDATKIDTMMQEISNTAAELSDVMQSVAMANEGISATVTQSTTGITNVVGNTNDLAEEMTGITDALFDMQNVVEVLKSEVKCFITY